MTVGDANNKMCPFADTKEFHGHDINYCVTDNCMAWVYTRKKSREPMRSNIDLPELEKEGVCLLTQKD